MSHICDAGLSKQTAVSHMCDSERVKNIRSNNLKKVTLWNG